MIYEFRENIEVDDGYTGGMVATKPTFFKPRITRMDSFPEVPAWDPKEAGKAHNFQATESPIFKPTITRMDSFPEVPAWDPKEAPKIERRAKKVRVVEYRTCTLDGLASELVADKLGVTGKVVGARRQVGKRFAPYEVFVVGLDPSSVGPGLETKDHPEGIQGPETIIIVPTRPNLRNVSPFPSLNGLIDLSSHRNNRKRAS